MSYPFRRWVVITNVITAPLEQSIVDESVKSDRESFLLKTRIATIFIQTYIVHIYIDIFMIYTQILHTLYKGLYLKNHEK